MGIHHQRGAANYFFGQALPCQLRFLHRWVQNRQWVSSEHANPLPGYTPLLSDWTHSERRARWRLGKMPATSILLQTQSRITEVTESASMTSRPRPMMGPEQTMGVLRTCQPSTRVHTAAFRLDPQ